MKSALKDKVQITKYIFDRNESFVE